MNGVLIFDVAPPPSGFSASVWILLIVLVVIVVVPLLIGLIWLLKLIKSRKSAHEPKPSMSVESLTNEE
jgi:flagellar basal body-associated protein FliL